MTAASGRKRIIEALAGDVANRCYAASEALFHLSGRYGRWEVWRWHPPGAATWHWYLRDRRTGEWVDLTADQFTFQVPYEKGTRTGFLTRRPSRHAQSLLREVAR